MKNFFYVLIIFVLNIKAYSQDIPQFLKAENFERKAAFANKPNVSQKHINKLLTKVNGRPYDVQSYDLYMNWIHPLSTENYDNIGKPYIKNEDRIFTGMNKITVKILQDNTSSIVLDNENLKILSIKDKDGQNLNFTIEGSLLTISLPSSLKKDDIYQVVINYKFEQNTNSGFYLYPKGMPVEILQNGDTAVVEERLAYTMSEPEDARKWMPCNDSPDDKAISSISIEVPKGFKAVSNGLLDKVVETDTSSIFIWKEKYPITTYLMAATASKYVEFSHWYKKTSNPDDSVEVQYYVWEKDFNGTKTDRTGYNAKNTFRNTTSMIKAFADRFGEYPYEKYGMVAIYPFDYGGMEHLSLTSINRNWMLWDSQSGIAHELAHQWLGDLITCATWKDIWINEGGATWSQALWDESNYGSWGYYNNLYWDRYLYLNNPNNPSDPMVGLNLPAIYGLPADSIFATRYGTILSYYKAAWVYHQLRTMLGDSSYFNILRGLLKDNAFQSVTTDDLMNYFKAHAVNPVVPIDTFFQQWVYSAGHPVYTLYSNGAINENSYIYTVRVNQVQNDVHNNGVRQLYIAPQQLFFTLVNDSVFAYPFLNDSREQTLKVTLPMKAKSVAIDTLNVLCELKSTITTGVELENSEDINTLIYPNPVKDGNDLHIEFSNDKQGFVTADIYDEIGSKAANIYEGQLEQGNYNFNFSTSNLSTGSYIIRIFNGERIISKRFTVIK